jgi:hypothetical protein
MTAAPEYTFPALWETLPMKKPDTAASRKETLVCCGCGKTYSYLDWADPVAAFRQHIGLCPRYEATVARR